jgi:Zn-dependent protease with chaperone function
MDERIRANKRKIIWGAAAFIVAIMAVTALFGAWIIYTYDNLAGWLALAGFILFDLVTVYVATHSGMWMVRWASRATRVYHGGAREARSAAEDISIATGMPAPEIMLIDEDFCNAFSLKDSKGAVIIVTSGLLKKLDDDELRAVIAHEMAHLYNEDATLNTFIASLRGFSLIARSVFGHVTGTVDSIVLGPVFEMLVLPTVIAFTILLPILSIFFGRDSSETLRIIFSAAIIVIVNLMITVIFGRLLQRLIDPYREMHADELAVKWTMYPEALTGALRKVEAHSNIARLAFLKGMFFAPVRTIRYAELSEFDLQPSIDQRIKNLEKTLHTPLDPGLEPPEDYLHL